MPNDFRLTSSQNMAIQHIKQYAASRRAAAQTSIREILHLSNIPLNTFEDAVSKLRSHARVALHFHPDRPLADNKNVVQALLEQGKIRVSLRRRFLTAACLHTQAVLGIVGR